MQIGEIKPIVAPTIQEQEQIDAELVVDIFIERRKKRTRKTQAWNGRHMLIAFVKHFHLFKGTNNDVVSYWEYLKARMDRGELKPTTINRTIFEVKTFLIFCKENGVNEQIDPDEIWKKIKYLKVPKTRITKHDVFSEKDVERILSFANGLRNKAMLSLMYDGALRPGEVCELKWRDMVFDDKGIKITVQFKTEKPRVIRLTYSYPHLLTYINNLSDPKPVEIEDSKFKVLKPDGYVFTSFVNPRSKKKELSNRPVKYCSLYKVFQNAVKRSGVSYRRPYTFRHTRFTELVEKNYPAHYVKQIGWGSMNTQMLDVYVHPSDDYIDKVAMEMSGMPMGRNKIQKEKTVLERYTCRVCSKVNTIGATFCDACGTPLSEKARLSRDGLLKLLSRFTDEEIAEILSTPIE